MSTQKKLKILLDKAPEKLIKVAELYYVDEQALGFKRHRRGQGFIYVSTSGKYISSPRQLKRFESLVIPPAWTDVWICSKASGHIQVTGRDDRGRKQYIYHPKWEKIRDIKKFGQMVLFSEVLPRIRAQVNKDLRRRKLSREKAIALVIHLLEETLIRVGNREYKRDNETFGLTTLSKNHLDIEGSNLFFIFKGKGGKQRKVNIKNRRLANIMKKFQELPGQELFGYLNEEGEYQSMDSGDVNEYLRNITGMDITAKYFRTWGGTVIMASELFNSGPSESMAEEKRIIVKAVKQVANILGNTASICRKYYIHPEIIEAYKDKTLFTVMKKELKKTTKSSHKLNSEERAVAQLLRRSFA